MRDEQIPTPERSADEMSGDEVPTKTPEMSAETTEEQPPQRLEPPEIAVQLHFHAPDGTTILSVGCPAAATDAAGVHLPAITLLQALFDNFMGWQKAQQPQPKPSGILVPNGRGALSVGQAAENAEKLQRALRQIHPRPGKRHD